MEQCAMVTFDLTKSINYAMQQNYIPVIRSLVVTNTGEDELCDLELTVSFTPSFAQDLTVRLDKLLPGIPTEISPVKIILSPDLLFSLIEAMAGYVSVTLTESGKQVFFETREIELLTYDQSVGLLSFPELISAFVTPNHPAVTGVLRNAAEYLAKWSGDPSFTAYQRQNPNAVKTQLAAVYAALQTENIAYAMPPAGYETSGQRVRLADRVLNEKMGTCLDLSVLYASCLEAVGLNPLLIFTKGHAFCGCWLEELTFPECVTEDISSLTKRIADGIDELCLIECTAFTAGKSVGFDEAVSLAARDLSDPGPYFSIVDIRRCRGSKIRPIPARVFENGAYKEVDFGKRSENDITCAPNEINMELHGASANKDLQVTKQTIWERKLLDLSLRNSLLNFRPGTGSVQLMTAGLASLEDELAKSESFRIMPVPEDFTLHRSDTKMFEAESGTSAVTAIAESEFRSGRLRSYLNAAELEKVLKKLHRQAKVSLEENGANTLYLALGFLRWYETEKSEKPRLAPLVLIPVDITRKIQDRSYSIKIRDEEPQMNVTLLELMRQDFGINIGGLSPLPLDEHGVNIPLVFNTVRQGVMSMKRWDIVEEAFLGQFSFSRFIMWNDIRSRCDDLRANKVVSSLISGKMEWKPQIASLTAEELDRDIQPSDMAIVSSADSSQLSAICEAARGSSFVLHGPPGTGKSQTITNMIANALYNKKTVLFVAEKMAALSVVQKRLEKIGLDPFCLELHSNKAQKRAVLSQLEKTLNVRKGTPPEDHKKVSDELFRQRSELNETVCALHKKQPHGRSLYELLTLYEQNISQKNKLSISAELVKSMNESTFGDWISAIRAFVLAVNEAGGVADSPFCHCNLKNYTTQLRDSFADRAAELYKNADKAENSFCSAFGAEPTGIAVVRACSRAASAVLSAEYPVEKAALDPDFSVKFSELERLVADGTALGKLNTELSAEFDAAAADGWNAGEALLKWRAAEQKWALAKTMEQGKLLKELALYRKAGKPTAEQFMSACERFSERKRLSESISEAPEELTAYFGALWSGLRTDFARLDKCLKENAAINEILRPICSTPFASAIFTAARGSSEDLGRFTADLSAYEKTAEELAEMYEIDFEGVYGEAPCCFDAAMSQSKLWAENIGALREHCALLGAKERLEKIGLSCAAQAFFGGNISCGELESALCCAFGYTAANLAISEEPRLAAFRGTQFEAAIEKFRELDSRFEELTVKELTAELSAKIPDISAGGAGSSEIGILLKAIKSGGRNMPIRKLFDSIPNLLRRICPCMLMSPISVAQYIDPAYPKFDLVIFDEASQLPTCEAVGAIARGENVVVVGDPKQLPPTSFFSSEHTDEENAEIDDLESVLDDCLALAMPQKHLQWHYRSRHESLIAYSNAKFYENSLMTFPSPDDIVSRVKWVHVEGFYDKGGSKQNKAEAQAIVDEIVRRLKDPALRRESIGVVTFSLVQQVLIDDMLSDAFRNAPELEQTADGMYEPIFVKNLENVQGDERDVILFSVGYGPDKEGNVSMNFGPLNREGGWRRLNVAITRARKSMQVYSVITADQIDISRTASEGVAALKGFLEFAQKGSRSLPVRVSSGESGTDDFAKLLSEEIRKMGYDVRCNIGCSGYKIDIGVVNPDEPGAYILGIRCDNERYLTAGSARDRSVSQPGMLKGLGWNICSVWIMDYFDSPEKTLARIRTAIENSIEAFRKPPESEDTAPQAEQVKNLETEEAEQDPQTAAVGTAHYEEFCAEQLGSAEDFYDEKSFADICSLCGKIVDVQTPVSRDVLFKKILGAYGINRTSAKAEAVLEKAAGALGLLSTSSENGIFYWKAGTFPASYELCRVPADGGVKRALDEICPQEISNGVRMILSNQLSMTKADLIRETAKLFGYTRLGGVMEACVSEGIDAAVRRGFAEINGERVGLKE